MSENKWISEWENFIKESKENEAFLSIFNEIKTAEKEQDEDSLRRVLNQVKKIDRKKKEELKMFHKWMSEFMNAYIPKTNWWDKFYIENAIVKELAVVFDSIEKADREETEASLNEAMAVIDSLDASKHKFDILNFKKRARILEKRLERKVSKNFGAVLASIRAQRGLSLAQTGKLADVSASYINRIESGERKAPSYPIIEKLAAALDVEVSTLLVAAGASAETTTVKSIRELLFSNSVYVSDKEKQLSVDKKQQLVEIISYISNMDWENNKHIETLNIIGLIDSFKEVEE